MDFEIIGIIRNAESIAVGLGFAIYHDFGNNMAKGTGKSLKDLGRYA